MTYRRPPPLILVALIVVAVSCSSENTATPGPSTGPAFAYETWDESKCGDDRCVTVGLRNFGNASGPGSCQLFGVALGIDGEGETLLPGPRVQLPVLEPEETFDATLRWAEAEPDGGFRIICEPGIRS